MEYSVPKLKAVDINLEAEVKQKIEEIKVEVINKTKEDGAKD